MDPPREPRAAKRTNVVRNRGGQLTRSPLTIPVLRVAECDDMRVFLSHNAANTPPDVARLRRGEMLPH